MKVLSALLLALISMASGYKYQSQPQHPSGANTYRGFRVHTYTSHAQAVNGSRTYTVRKPGRHVCMLLKSYSEPMMVKETFIKPDTSQCSPKVCSTTRMVYASRFVPKHRIVKKEAYSCCPGWSHTNRRKHDCNLAVCGKGCRNGGSCLKPDLCSCTRGYTGHHCETDVDECLTKPCDHTCVNTLGSYYCTCNEGFTLQADGLSCRSEEVEDAVEITDLNGYDVKYCTNAVRSERLTDCTNKKLHEISDKLQNIIQTMSFMNTEFQSFRNIQNDHHQWILGAGKIMDQVNPLSFRVQELENKLKNCGCCNGRESNSASWEEHHFASPTSDPDEETRSMTPISSRSEEESGSITPHSSDSKEPKKSNRHPPSDETDDEILNDKTNSKDKSSQEPNSSAEKEDTNSGDNAYDETEKEKEVNQIDEEIKDTSTSTTTVSSWPW